MKYLINRVVYIFISFLTLFTNNKAIVKKKLIIGSIIVGLAATTSCRAFIPVRHCYAPVPGTPEIIPDEETQQEEK